MKRFTSIGVPAALAVVAASSVLAAQAQWAGQTFLSDYSKLTQMPAKTGEEWVYTVANSDDVLAKYNGIMIDQPEVSISPNSPDKSVKPDDLKAIADLMRVTIDERLTARGYRVVDQGGNGVLFLRVGLTDLQLKSKKRNLLAYTPIGAVVNAGVKALQDMMQKTDIIDVTMQAEVLDSQTNQVLGAIVIKRGATADAATGQKAERIDFDEFKATVADYSDRLACRVVNSRSAQADRVDCLDPAARAAQLKKINAGS